MKTPPTAALVSRLGAFVILCSAYCSVTQLNAAALCVDISGTWSLTESVTVRTIQNGSTNTDFQSGTAPVEILQRGCNFTIVSHVENPLTGNMMTVRRPGKIVGRTATFSGKAALVAFGCQQNRLLGTGVINTSSMDFTTTGLVLCSAPGEQIRVEVEATEIFETDRTLVFPPFITTQPAKQIVGAGTNVVLTVTADGSSPLSFQWFQNRKPIEGAIGPTLELPNVQKLDSGAYSVAISNSLGRVSSRAARLRVR
jgi:hypothetical protein